MSDETVAALERRIAQLKADNRRMRSALTSIVKRADDGGTLYEVRGLAADALDNGERAALNKRRDSVERVLLGRDWQLRGGAR